uniref:Exportin-4 n=1 Tax=Globodera rostochiensis TaxID=31243 RepID=A0A914HYN3_GLORO
MAVSISNELSKLEFAAQVIMASPNQVSSQDRKDAEALFMSLREADPCFGGSTVEGLDELPGLTYKLAELCVYGNVPLGCDDCQTVVAVVGPNDNHQLQAFGLQIIELVATEFNTTWRASAHSISWDFHRMAKKEFEKVLLKQLLKLSLNTLSRLMNSSNLSSPSDQQVCDKFLCVASLIFCWNFQPKHLFLDFRILFQAFRTNSFRPPENWNDLFQDASIVTFFMQLHTHIRHNEQLCQNSLTCLAQLASAMGDSLGLGPIALVVPQVSGDLNERRLATSMSGGAEHLSEELSTHDLYVRTFTRELIQIFSGTVFDHEMASLSLIVYKLFSCQPIPVFKRFPAELLRNFVEFVATNTITLIEPAMQLALKNDHTYHEPLSNFFFVWRTMIRTLYEHGTEEFIRLQTQKILECFFKSVLSPPFGNRNKLSYDEIFDENAEEEDDQKVFMDLLNDIGHFSLNAIDFFTEFVISVLTQRLRELRSIDVVTCTQEQLQAWQEDFHWILLIIEELALRCLDGYKSGEFVKLGDLEPLFSACLANPPFDPATYPGKLDPATLISSQILSWFSMEHQMLLKLEPGASLLSPTLCETSFSNFTNFIVLMTPSAYWSSESPPNNEEDDDGRERKNEFKLLPSIPRGTNLSTQIIQLALEKFVVILTKMPCEKNLCKSAINLMTNFAEHRPQDLATNEHLYTVLSSINIEKLPSRRELIKSLVLLGQMNERKLNQATLSFEEQIGNKIQVTILDPMLLRFLSLCNSQRSCSDESALADYFECFAGVADAGQSDTAERLFAFLSPVFERCVPLITAHSDSQILIVAILDFIKSATDVLFFHVDHMSNISYHKFLLDLVNAYKQTQFHRFRSDVFVLRGGDSNEGEQQTLDLSTLIEILCLFHSKTYLPPILNTEVEKSSAKISLQGLELLLPLMTEELLKVPQLCASFFRLLIFISDVAIEAIVQSSPQILANLLRCVNAALDNVFGIDRVRSALEIVNGLASYCIENSAKKTGECALLIEQLLSLIPKMLQLSMEYSCELDLLSEATTALYSLIVLGLESFNVFVNQLLCLPSNQENRERLENAFRQLLAPFLGPDNASSAVQSHAQKKRRFQRNFEDFLIEVSGSLCLS